MRLSRTRFAAGRVLLLAAVSTPVVALQQEPPQAPGLIELAEPNLAQFEETIQEQLRGARDSLDRLVAASATDRSELHLAFFRMGQLYLTCDLADLARDCFLNASRLEPEDFRAQYYLGVLGLFEGDFVAAADHLETGLLLRGPDLATLLRLGEADLSLGRLEEAEKSFSQALDLDPGSAAAQDGLGRVASQQGDAAAAIRYFTLALELQPEADSIHHRLGMAYRESGDLEKARHHLAQNRGTRVKFPDPLMDGLGGLIQSSQQIFNAGIDAMRSGDYDKAVAMFERALAEKPDDYLIPYNLASAQLKLGNRASAEEWLRRSVEIDPNFRNGHFNLASMLARDGNFEEAAWHFQRAHEIDPEDQVAHLEWATALSRIGQSERAAEELRELLSLDPTNSQALLNLGTLLLQLGEESEAVEVLERILVVSADPIAQAHVHFRLASLAEYQQQWEVALRHLEDAAALAPDSVDIRLALAASLGRATRYADSADQFRVVTSLEPDNLRAHFGLAMALLLGEDHGRAKNSLEQSLEQLPEEPSLRHALARLLATCPDPAIRDGWRALSLARGVYDASPTLDHAETVAMALAEVGQFEEAVAWQRRVVEEAESQATGARAEQARHWLDLFERGQPVRAPWRSG